MVERVFEFLFVAALFAPPATVVVGICLLIAPRRRHHVQHAPHAVGV